MAVLETSNRLAGAQESSRHRLSVGASAGLQNSPVLDDPSRCRCLPIPFFLFHCSLAAAFERRWHSICRRNAGDGAFTLGTVFGRLIGGLLMDRMIARFAFMLAFFAIPRFLFGDSRLCNALWIAYGAAILYGIAFGWTFIA